MTHRLRGIVYWGAILCLVSALVAGCGGGGGSATRGLTPVRVTIAWAARGRTIKCALIRPVRCRDAQARGGGWHGFHVYHQSNAAPTAYTQTYASTAAAKVGTWPMSTQFFAQAGGGGAVVGTASATVTLKSDGTGIGDIATSGTIASVAVPPGQGVEIGRTTF